MGFYSYFSTWKLSNDKQANIILFIGSQKAQKNRLVEEAYNIHLFKSKAFYFDSKEQTYKPLTEEVYNQIQNGSIRL